MANLMEGLLNELERNVLLEKMYEDAPMGHIGAAMIRSDIEKAKRAICEGDLPEMVVIYSRLKSHQ